MTEPYKAAFVMNSVWPRIFGWSKPKTRLFPFMGKIHVRGNNPLTAREESTGIELLAYMGQRGGTIGFWSHYLCTLRPPTDFDRAERVADDVEGELEQLRLDTARDFHLPDFSA